MKKEEEVKLKKLRKSVPLTDNAYIRARGDEEYLLKLFKLYEKHLTDDSKDSPPQKD